MDGNQCHKSAGPPPQLCYFGGIVANKFFVCYSLTNSIFLSFRKDNRQKYFIDVWPVDFLNPDDSNIFGTTSLFLMQLATILNMVRSVHVSR